MRTIIAGGHGKIALRLERLLGGDATGLVRNPAHVADVEATGARAVLCDLERASVAEIADILRGADAVVFAAGAGPGSGPARKDTVDRGASVLLADAAERAGVRRFVQISSMGAGRPPEPGGDEVWAAYITAKTEAEHDLTRRSLDWTILRPGALTDDPGTGLVLLDLEVPRGRVPRDDVAAVIAALLRQRAGLGQVLELVSGGTPIDEAITALP
ncbi:nucleoside-diphosphate-sugar epimerase [Nonomuraea muscovyensis]|uniref:Nucleoside-diphosphate-sugar epimerase n=1 Tax=Nonomuraea muscovyensis TaxID=1124761 RepID=A0A7X0CDL1_9ACTN|nr:SDR family oxidoreductase [Nonomuraea muscovyensis]MBB6352246.1 nucleoside-diphosphate-sugar epimerase [Nonomuraea muscovyensis]